MTSGSFLMRTNTAFFKLVNDQGGGERSTADEPDRLSETFMRNHLIVIGTQG